LSSFKKIYLCVDSLHTMGKSTEEFIAEMLEAGLGNRSMLVTIREKIRLGKSLSSYEGRYLNVLKRRTKNESVIDPPKNAKPKIMQEKVKQKEYARQSQIEIISAIREQEKLVAEKQKELESYQTDISSQQDLNQSKQDELVNMRTRLLNLQTQSKVLHMETDSQKKLLDETRQHDSKQEQKDEHHELESEIKSKRGEIAELKKQKQSVMQQTEQMAQKISEKQKQIEDEIDFLSIRLEMLEKQKTDILEEIAQEQAKKQSQEDELQALAKERLGLISKNKIRRGMDEQIQKCRANLHTVQNERSMLELEIKSQMNLLDDERQKEKEIMARIMQKYN